MRTQVLFDNVDAGISHTVDIPVPCFQDMRFLIQITKTGTDGIPRLYVEESVDNVIWTAMSSCDNVEYFPLSSSPIGIKDNYFMGKYMRVRLDPATNTTGTIYGIIGYKTKP